MEDSEYDEYTQSSVSVECNATLDVDKVLHNEEEVCSPLGTGGDRSSPMTVFHTGDVPYSGAPCSLETFNNIQEKPDKGKYVNISETLEENRNLKSANFILQLENYNLKKELPELRDDNGVDFTMEYIKCKSALHDAENTKLKLETQLKEISDKLVVCISDKEKERVKWEEEKKQLVASVDQLKIEKETYFNENVLDKYRTGKLPDESGPSSSSVYDSDASQAESSIFSERDQQLDVLQQKMAIDFVKNEVMRRNFLKQIDGLTIDLKEKDGKLQQLTNELEVERNVRKEMQVENVRLQDMFSESEKCKEALKDQLEENRKQYQIDVFKRDRAINALMRRCEAARIPEATAYANENDKVFSDVAGILHRVQEIDDENMKIREKAIKLATEDGASLEDLTSSDILSAGGDVSEVNVKQIIEKNKKIAKYLDAECIKQQQSMDPSLREEVQCKMAAFDAIETSDDSSSVVVQPIHSEISVNTGGVTANNILNASRIMNREVEGLQKKIDVIRKICVQLFEKLRGSAATLQKILDQLYGNGEGHSLLEEVEAMHLDFNQSVNTADYLSSNFEVVQKSLLELTEVFERSVIPQLYNTLDGCEVSLLTEKDCFNEGQLKTLKKELDTEREKASSARAEVEELTKKMQQLEMDNKKILSDRDVIEMNMAEVRSTLEKANDEVCKMKSECVCYSEELLKLRSDNEEKVTELKQVSDQLAKTERDFKKYKVYFEELTSVEEESKRLIQSLRETISSIPQKVVKVITGNEHIVSENDEALKIAEADKDVIALRDEFTQMRATIDETSSNIEALKVKCDQANSETAALKCQKEAVEVELAGLRKKFCDRVAKSVQTDLSQSQMMAREAEYERCAMDNSISKENISRLCAALSQLQEEQHKSEFTSSAVSQLTSVVHDERRMKHGTFCTKAETMTSLCSSDIARMEVGLAEYANFANDVYGMVTRKDDRPFDYRHSLNIKELDKLKIDVNKAVLTQQGSKHSSAKLSMKQLSPQEVVVEDVDSMSSTMSSRHLKSSDVAASLEFVANVGDAENVSKEFEMICSNEPCLEIYDKKMGSLLCKVLADKFWKRILDYSNEIVQIIKAHKSDCKWESKDKLLERARAFRGKIYYIREQVNSVEKLKENLDPSMMVRDLQEKVVDLQHELSNANRLLKEADARLAGQPNTDSIRALILEEMAKIRNVMKAVGKAAAYNRIPASLPN
uniref:DUF5741 domain-containing protein n=1 Tax=Syphacia muris TaxID=451379 RepID=A0A0N5AIS7_9BILA